MLQSWQAMHLMEFGTFSIRCASSIVMHLPQSVHTVVSTRVLGNHYAECALPDLLQASAGDNGWDQGHLPWGLDRH